ncbi:uncharacterized protein V1516DRAFT_454956 [Lipomyces oligophaga]|uniref:uncharacterized protein n=1 Tax=Lipomyces oligophaga TaxID=45792 RepID=UPI0034CD25AC
MSYSITNRETVELLSIRFERVLTDIADKMNLLMEQTCQSSDKHHDHCVLVADEAADELAKLRSLMDKCEDLDLEFAKIKRIGEIVREFRNRVIQLERIV